MSSESGKRLWVVIAAYNEAEVLGRVVADVRQREYQIVVVDDGSGDATGEMAHNAGAAVVRHPVNLGQGAALQTGIYYALCQGADYIITFDADGQHRVQDIDALIAAIEKHGVDFALGSASSARRLIFLLRGASCSRLRSASPASPPGSASPTRTTACAP